MSFDQEIADVRARLAKATLDRNQWRVAGRQEKYLESYFLVDALELQLDKLRLRRIESTARSASSLPVHVPAPSPARFVEAPDDAQRRQMAELGVTFLEGEYRFGPYRYDRFADAMRYARLQNGAGRQ
jgi:hypothetical protein